MEDFKVTYSTKFVFRYIKKIILIIFITVAEFGILVEFFQDSFPTMESAFNFFKYIVAFNTVFIIVCIIQLVYILTFSITVTGNKFVVKNLVNKVEYKKSDLISLTEKEQYKSIKVYPYWYKTNLVRYVCTTKTSIIKFTTRMNNYNLFIQYIDNTLYQRHKKFTNMINQFDK